MPEVERWVADTVGAVRQLCPAKRLTLMLTFPSSSFDCGASQPPPRQPTSVCLYSEDAIAFISVILILGRVMSF